MPFREFIVKVAARCNLACDYCYMYEMADDGWRTQPRFVSDQVVRRIGKRIDAHAVRHGLDSIVIMLHGGEPLLAGAHRLAAIAAILRSCIAERTEIRFSIETNGVLLDKTALEVLADAGIRVCVSLDGDAESHDRHRQRRNGAGSHAEVVRALDLFDRPRFRPLFAGLLCVVDLANDPSVVYRSLVAAKPPAIDFLLPFGNWSTPPPGRWPDDSTPYGDWLIAAFDAWYDTPSGRPEVRFFREIITLLLGGRSRTEQVGLSPACMVVFNLDGTIEQVDSLRSVGHGAASTAMSVFTHDLDAALAHPAIRSRQYGIHALADECQRCPLVRVCGGGHYVHRFRDGDFCHRSVYCADLTRLIHHVRDRVERDLAGYRETVR